jgi:hypothetical protein
MWMIKDSEGIIKKIMPCWNLICLTKHFKDVVLEKKIDTQNFKVNFETDVLMEDKGMKKFKMVDELEQELMLEDDVESLIDWLEAYKMSQERCVCRKPSTKG